MKIKKLNSISEVNKIYETAGSQPVKILCSDTNFYVCKYFRGTGQALSLFNEFIAAAFLKIWGLNVPDFSFVKIKPEHLAGGLSKIWFEKYCFASKFVEAKEVENFFYDAFTSQDKNKPYLYSEALLIGLFDIWICNDDRNINNTNLLLSKEKKFIPIDHTQIFNGNNIDKEPYLINEYDTILHQYFVKKLFSKKYFLDNFGKIFEKLKKIFYIALKDCKAELNNLLNTVPNDWELDIDFLRQKLLYFFSDEWRIKVIKQFEIFLYHIYKH